MWTLSAFIGVLNVGITVWLRGTSLSLWLIVNVALLIWVVTLLQWAVAGLLWRKDPMPSMPDGKQRMRRSTPLSSRSTSDPPDLEANGYNESPS